MSVTDHPGLSLFFRVTLDVVDLGYWTKVSGLGMTIATDDRGEAAMSFFQHHLPNHMTYNKLTLERPVSSDTSTVMNWISTYHMLPVPTAGEITCVDQTGAVLMAGRCSGSRRSAGRARTSTPTPASGDRGADPRPYGIHVGPIGARSCP